MTVSDVGRVLRNVRAGGRTWAVDAGDDEIQLGLPGLVTPFSRSAVPR
jgi:hypothetical protein